VTVCFQKMHQGRIATASAGQYFELDHVIVCRDAGS
jgi:hypothetical protein